MINKAKLTLVLPCRNEESALKAVLSNLPSEVDEVIVVDNLSKDKTIIVAKSFGARVLLEPRTQGGIGYGFALATGINNASGEIVACMDGDGSYPVGFIPEIVGYLQQNNLDFISCNRLPVRHPKKMSAIRALGINILNFAVWALFGYPIRDSLTGMWIFKKNVVSGLTIFEGDWNFSLEIKLSAINNPKVRFSEYYIPYEDRKFDQSKQSLFKTGYNHFIFLLKKKIYLTALSLTSQPRISLLDA